MKRHWITYDERWQPGPMSFWVHREVGTQTWLEAAEHSPPLPRPVPGKGYASYHVEVDRVIFHFASLDELQVCIDTLSLKLLPTTIRLSRERGTTVGPNGHWLSQLPMKAKPWRYREKAVKYLREAQAEFKKKTGAK